MMNVEFTEAELEAIAHALNQAILDGFAESDEDPIMTAYEKITSRKVYEGAE